MRIKIIKDQYHTKVVDVDTGELIEGVVQVNVSLDINGCYANITIGDVDLDIDIDANIDKISKK